MTAPVPGSPSWWATRPVPDLTPRRGRPSLDPGHIVATAMELVDEHGIPAFSLRMLADTLNSGTATLYRHFESKDEIVAHIVDRVLGEVELPHLKPDASWQDALSAMGLRFYEVLRRHPNVVPALIAQVPIGPNGLAQREHILRALLERGMPADLAARAFTAVGHYVIGFTAQQHGPAAAPPEAAGELGRFYRQLDPETFPSIAEAAATLTNVPLDEEFNFGLQLLIGGLQRHLERSGIDIAPPGDA